MSLALKRKDGSVTPYKNSALIPMYYIIPEVMLKVCDKSYERLPRDPAALFYDRKLIAFVESDNFLEIVIDATAYIVWTFLDPKHYMEIYSGYDPLWRLAHSVGYWYNLFLEKKFIMSINDIYKLRHQSPFEFEVYDMIALTDELCNIIPPALEKDKIYQLIEEVKHNRCLEDFDDRSSYAKEDFHRKWYHSRAKHKMVSLEQEQENYAEQNNGAELDFADDKAPFEPAADSKIDVSQFMSQLSEKEQKVLELRLKGRTLSEIAEQLGYKNHSGVQKIIKKIGLKYEEFADVDFNFSELK